LTPGYLDSPPRSLLLLADVPEVQANTIRDHVEAFGRWSRHDVFVFNPSEGRDSRIIDLEAFDVVVIHYSLSVTSDHHVSPRLRDRLHRYSGLKVQFIQDGYRRIEDYCACIRELGVRLLFTCWPVDEGANVWTPARLPGVSVLHSLTGYVPEQLALRTPRPMRMRPYHIGYRSRPVPFWLGRLGQEKTVIGREFLARAPGAALRCNISTSEESRIYGESWIDFLRACRAVLGTESGASVVDVDGSIERRVREYLEAHPGASFDEVGRAILEPHEDRPRHATISPRVFEAIALRTALVMFPGVYSRIVRAWDHYIPLQADFSNFREVADLLKDDAFLDALTERAWNDIVGSGLWSYRSGIREFDAAIEEHLGPARRRHKIAYGLARLVTSEQGLVLKRAAATGRRLVAGTALARWVLRSTSARKLLARLIDCRRHNPASDDAPPWARFLADVLRLLFLQEVARSTSPPFRVHCFFDRPTGTLRLRSTPASSGDCLGTLRGATPEIAGSVRSMVWDHSRVGSSLRLGESGPVVPLGAAGVYPFTTIPWLAATAPDLLGELLMGLPGPRASDGSSQPPLSSRTAASTTGDTSSK
jgi:hypothetical protein